MANKTNASALQIKKLKVSKQENMPFACALHFEDNLICNLVHDGLALKIVPVDESTTETIVAQFDEPRESIEAAAKALGGDSVFWGGLALGETKVPSNLFELYCLYLVDIALKKKKAKMRNWCKAIRFDGAQTQIGLDCQQKAIKAKKAKGAPKKRKPVKPSGKPRKRGVGAVITELLIEGHTDKEAIVKAAKKEFPQSSTNVSCVSWYQNKLRKEGKIQPASKKGKKA